MNINKTKIYSELVSGVSGTYVTDISQINNVDTFLQNKLDFLEEIEYSTLRNKCVYGLLTPGRKYKIIDYETIVNPNIRGENNIKSAGHVFDIIVTAVSKTELSEHAYAMKRPGDSYFSNCNLNLWELKYTIHNDVYQWSSSLQYVDNEGNYFYRDSLFDIQWEGQHYFAFSKDDRETVIYTTSLENLQNFYTINKEAITPISVQSSEYKKIVFEDNNYMNLYLSGIIYYYIGKLNGVTAIYCTDKNNPENSLYRMASKGKLSLKPIEFVLNKRFSESKGCIYYMKDEYGNECPYDFKNIMVKDVFEDMEPFEAYEYLRNHLNISEEVNFKNIYFYTFPYVSFNSDNAESFEEIVDASIINNSYYTNNKIIGSSTMEEYNQLYFNIIIGGSNTLYKSCNNIIYGYDNIINHCSDNYVKGDNCNILETSANLISGYIKNITIKNSTETKIDTKNSELKGVLQNVKNTTIELPNVEIQLYLDLYNIDKSHFVINENTDISNSTYPLCKLTAKNFTSTTLECSPVSHIYEGVYKNCTILNNNNPYTDCFITFFNEKEISLNLDSNKTDKHLFVRLDSKGEIKTFIIADLDADALRKISDITYSELKLLQNNKNLIPGKQYRIMDFVTTCNDTGSVDGVTTRSAGNAFDIIVTADSTDTLNENARAVIHDGDTYFADSNLGAWLLKYCLDNDTDRFAWADSEGKGVIYYMKDEFDNECFYDFKNIQYQVKSIKNISGNWKHDKDLSNIGMSPEQFYYTYSYDNNGTIQDLTLIKNKAPLYDSKCKNNKIIEKQNWAYKMTLPCIVGVSYPLDNNIYSNIEYEIGLFGNNIVDNDFGNLPTGIFFVAPFERNNFVSLARYMIFNPVSIGNFFKDSIQWNYFGKSFIANDVSASFINNIIGKCFQGNSIGNNFQNNIISNECYSNAFGDNCHDNTINEYCENNTFGNNCAYNTFGKACEGNTFGNNCAYNIFGRDCDHNTFGNNCYNNTFGIFCHSNSLGNDCTHNTSGDDFRYNDMGNSNTNNVFGDACHSNSLGNSCHYNIFGNAFNYNKLGNSCYGITFRKGADLESSLLDNVLWCRLDQGCSYIVLYADTTESDKIKHLHITAGVKGAEGANKPIEEIDTPLYINIPKNTEYQVKIAANSAGEVKIYCEADLIA